jgi:hypothetical protein
MPFGCQTRPDLGAALAVATMNPRSGGVADGGGERPRGIQTRPFRLPVSPDATVQRSGLTC